MSTRSNRNLKLAALLVAAAAPTASAWPEPRVHFDIRKQFTIHGGQANWSSVQGTYFAHTWWRESDGTVFNTLTNPLTQPATFHDYGNEIVENGETRNRCGPSIFSPPYPNCQVGISHGPVNIGTYHVPMGGTPYSYLNGHSYQIFGAWLVGASCGGEVWYDFAPWGNGQPVSGEMRVNGRYTPMWTDRASGPGALASYAYAVGEVKVFGNVPPAPPALGFGVNCALAFGQYPGASPPPPGSYSPRAINQVRVRDPITYTIVDDATGQVTTGTLFSVWADLLSDGDINWDAGVLNITAPECEFHIVKAGEFGLPESRYSVVVQGGVVTDSEATGQFAFQGSVPIGTNVPLWMSLDDNMFFNLDVAAAAPNGGGLTIAMSNSGPEDLGEPDEPAPCAADFDEDGAATVGDIFRFLASWFALEARTDIDEIPGPSIGDIFRFLAIWFQGCP